MVCRGHKTGIEEPDTAVHTEAFASGQEEACMACLQAVLAVLVVQVHLHILGIEELHSWGVSQEEAGASEVEPRSHPS